MCNRFEIYKKSLQVCPSLAPVSVTLKSLTGARTLQKGDTKWLNSTYLKRLDHFVASKDFMALKDCGSQCIGMVSHPTVLTPEAITHLICVFLNQCRIILDRNGDIDFENRDIVIEYDLSPYNALVAGLHALSLT